MKGSAWGHVAGGGLDLHPETTGWDERTPRSNDFDITSLFNRRQKLRSRKMSRGCVLRHVANVSRRAHVSRSSYFWKWQTFYAYVFFDKNRQTAFPANSSSFWEWTRKEFLFCTTPLKFLVICQTTPLITSKAIGPVTDAPDVVSLKSIWHFHLYVATVGSANWKP